jgi:hypothetical protein
LFGFPAESFLQHYHPKYLFIIDGAKALRTAIEEVLGRE